MREAGIIEDYALFGAAAQMRYTEAVATLDADVGALAARHGLAETWTRLRRRFLDDRD